MLISIELTRSTDKHQDSDVGVGGGVSVTEAHKYTD